MTVWVPLQEAEELLASTAKPSGSRRRRRDKDARSELAEPGVTVNVNGTMVHVPPEDADALAAQAARDAVKAAKAAARGAPEGGWGEDMDMAEGEDAAAKFKPGIKFKLAS